ncbi:cysteine desulfurase family protein [Sphingobium sp. CCH11-B1]|jgi:cysteine desulfurase|uniref:cysteine desulfurase family protein n=1 Tax=Sphingobium sp. CCH11-B1 TaxID=1768781 RepID=UPI000836437B|nr:cysteine desulfurase family protein [Sphingobium sp. CCH11-B1]MEA3388529.1 cysteine desulfurase family protein [Pseudomonadota bacterium]
MIYLDYQATTPLAPEAFDAMLPLLRDQFANPHSAHRLGRAAAAHVEVARDEIGRLLPQGGRLVFTSGATEALNIAIQGAPPGGIVTIATEHAAVLDTVEAMRRKGRAVTILPVGPDGLVDAEEAARAIVPGVAIVVAMLVNNEIGVIQPLDALSELAHSVGALFLCDAVQGYGRIPVPQACDLVAISAHKVHGPKGIGALWMRDGVQLEPLIHGGGQEQGLRSGTLSPALCAGFGVAARLMRERAEEDRAHIEQLAALSRNLFADWTLNGSADHRYPGNLNVRREGIDGARLLSYCRNIAFSLGSACASGSGRPSHVLRALGLTDAQARGSVRIGFGRYTHREELERAAEALNEAATAQAEPWG